MSEPITQAPVVFWTGRRLFLGLLTALLLWVLGLDFLTGSGFDWQQSLSLPFGLGVILTAWVGAWVVPLLRQLKAGQIIREDGPQSHLKKTGTPTMGGIFMIPTGLGVGVVWAGVTQGEIPVTALAIAALTLAFGAIGWWDDWQVLVRKSNKGMSAKLRLLFEGLAAAGFCAWLATANPTVTTIDFPWGWLLPLGLLFWPLGIFVCTAEGNALNLTDGLDGLAGGTAAIALMGLAVLGGAEHPEVTILGASLSGACLGFLVHNHNPAQVFMGDTGSLALGAALAGLGLVSQNLWELFILSGLFFAESLSVIAQVGYYKATKGPDGIGKRLFKMAPLHHHFELSGWTELQVVARFYLIVGGLVLLCFGFNFRQVY
ncbi:phospho-N-acetylmuramoyl-pentapeptide-transferase [Thermosynechococcaceae cyanobacterium BACA0444]|uniref:Phospho-N-acetylmuramoyl-pentapeptide-transferase n=1 Tax=Pseudocalidococcus azoricus BACA0444 TaxID=2918990 RepID=A0AAE4FS38_9CYAN|nr:phospho-N-acetylmuramoyl-pentapeptide-transferase [Pseudocalidococcus azoricus]MDS3859911.1 phospho-N-acetylmuramoyl-pentapeptide-transferase [Pseudocalidococcus azoricus BACA0444]